MAAQLSTTETYLLNQLTSHIQLLSQELKPELQTFALAAITEVCKVWIADHQSSSATLTASLGALNEG